MAALQSYIASRDALHALIGREGVAELEAVAPHSEGDSLKRIRAVARSHRLAGVTIAAAYEAAVEHRSVFARWIEVRRELRRSKLIARPEVRRARWKALETPDERRAECARRREAPLRDAIARVASRVEVTIEWVADASECGVEVEKRLDWDGYSKRCKYPMETFVVTCRAVKYPSKHVPGGSRVLADGLLLLSADPVESEFRAWAVVAARKSRGVAWSQISGYLVQTHGGAKTVFANALDRAEAKLRRCIASTAKQRLHAA